MTPLDGEAFFTSAINPIFRFGVDNKASLNPRQGAKHEI
jgi:hypothetical protein